MKRIGPLLLAFMMICLLTATAVCADTTESDTYLVGDADGDGAIAILDATRVQRLLAGLVADELSAVRGDINGNGLDILDATAIQRYIAGFETESAIGDIRIYPVPIEPATDAETTPGTQPETQPFTVKPTGDPNELPFIPSR